MLRRMLSLLATGLLVRSSAAFDVGDALAAHHAHKSAVRSSAFGRKQGDRAPLSDAAASTAAARAAAPPPTHWTDAAPFARAALSGFYLDHTLRQHDEVSIGTAYVDILGKPWTDASSKVCRAEGWFVGATLHMIRNAWLALSAARAGGCDRPDARRPAGQTGAGGGATAAVAAWPVQQRRQERTSGRRPNADALLGGVAASLASLLASLEAHNARVVRAALDVMDVDERCSAAEFGAQQQEGAEEGAEEEVEARRRECSDLLEKAGSRGYCGADGLAGGAADEKPKLQRLRQALRGAAAAVLAPLLQKALRAIAEPGLCALPVRLHSGGGGGSEMVHEEEEEAAAAASRVPSTVTLSNGVVMPRLGYGLGDQVSEHRFDGMSAAARRGPAGQAKDAVAARIMRAALDAGVRMFDCAQLYANSYVLGRVLAKATADGVFAAGEAVAGESAASGGGRPAASTRPALLKGGQERAWRPSIFIVTKLVLQRDSGDGDEEGVGGGASSESEKRQRAAAAAAAAAAGAADAPFAGSPPQLPPGRMLTGAEAVRLAATGALRRVVRASFQTELDALGTRYVDMLMYHHSDQMCAEGKENRQCFRLLWRELEALVDEGRVRSLGATVGASFRSDQDGATGDFTWARIAPVAYEAHLSLMVPAAWSMLGQDAVEDVRTRLPAAPRLITISLLKADPLLWGNPHLAAAAARRGAFSSEKEGGGAGHAMALLWALQHGTLQVPSSMNGAHIRANTAAHFGATAANGFSITPIEPLQMALLDALPWLAAFCPMQQQLDVFGLRRAFFGGWTERWCSETGKLPTHKPAGK